MNPCLFGLDEKPKLLWLLVRLGKLVEKILLVWFSQHLGVPEQQRRPTWIVQKARTKI